jgi:hypothetical protein
MGLVEVMLPLVILGLVYVLLFTAARAKGNEEGASRRAGK